ncbi:MAG: toprim domain-containing protein [Flavobacteriales bacterium]|nr:toprim domain-containing protein [Flavobacteriales bacterium]
MKEKRFNCERARSVSIVDTMAKLGHFPVRETEKEAWFLSPFRSETQASFKVSKTLNRWYDHGEGLGGNVIDLVCRLKGFGVGETLTWLQDQTGSFSFHQPLPVLKESKISIHDIRPISHVALIDYLQKRQIPLTLANGYIKQVHFKIGEKPFFALGLQNDKGGWELRNCFQKYCASPKAITLIENHNPSLTVVEGMFDFLSLLVIRPKWAIESDVLVLNSLAFATKVNPILDSYTTIDLALDNDSAGDKATQNLMESYPNAIDRRESYAEFKDMNEKLMHHGQE